MVVPSAETDFVGDFRRKTYHLHFTFTLVDIFVRVLRRLPSSSDSV